MTEGIGQQDRDASRGTREGKRLLIAGDEAEELGELLANGRRRGLVGIEAELGLVPRTEEDHAPAAAKNLHEQLERSVPGLEGRNALLGVGLEGDDRALSAERTGGLHDVAIVEEGAVVGVAAVDVLRGGLQGDVVAVMGVASENADRVLGRETGRGGVGLEDIPLPGEEVGKGLLVVEHPVVPVPAILVGRAWRLDRVEGGEVRAQSRVHGLDRTNRSRADTCGRRRGQVAWRRARRRVRSK